MSAAAAAAPCTAATGPPPNTHTPALALRAELKALRALEVHELLEFYGLQVHGVTSERLAGLAAFIGCDI